MFETIKIIIKTRWLILRGYSSYHAHMLTANKTDIKAVFDQKLFELNKVKNNLNFPKNKKSIAVAVLGCADQRYVDSYDSLFQKLLGREVETTIYDVTIDHLPSDTKVVQYDCTKVLPNKYDLIFSHILINFLKPSQQRSLIDSARISLNNNGVAIHIYAKDSDCDGFNLEKYVYHLSKEVLKYVPEMNKTYTLSRTYLEKSKPYNY